MILFIFLPYGRIFPSSFNLPLLPLDPPPVHQDHVDQDHGAQPHHRAMLDMDLPRNHPCLYLYWVSLSCSQLCWAGTRSPCFPSTTFTCRVELVCTALYLWFIPACNPQVLSRLFSCPIATQCKKCHLFRNIKFNTFFNCINCTIFISFIFSLFVSSVLISD